MIVGPLWPVLIAATNGTAADKMTYEEAKERIPERELPAFWVGDVAPLSEQVAAVKRGQVTTLASTPGKRPLHLVVYGEREEVEHKANFNSAIGGREPEAYMDKAARRKPVIFLVGPVHGHETEALAGLCNLISVMETGKDLRGKEQSELRALGEQCRLLIIPAGNPDGVARFEPRSLQGMELDDIRFWGQGTWSDDTLCGWPECKRQHPMMGDNCGFLGCYYNDAGINPMHDEFLAPMGPEAPAILKVALEEGPDLAVSLHSHQAAPAVLRPAYVTTEAQEAVAALAEQYYELLEARGLPHGGVPGVAPEGGEHPAPFNLTSALYHISGATSFTFECPHGVTGEKACQVSCEQIVDIQLALYEAMMRFGLGQKQAEAK
jgi:hypothetical protein